MAGSIPRRWVALLALMGALVAASFGFMSASAPKAEAALTPYCNNILYGAYGYCWGAQRVHYATYGWGEQHSVCVWSAAAYAAAPYPMTPPKCSSGPGVGVYNPYGANWNTWPGINNNAAGLNRLHGVAYQP